MSERGTELEIPQWLSWLHAEPGGAEWLNRLPKLVSECAAQWDLRLGAPFRGNVSYVASATTASGSEVVLKINFPSPESEHESAALRHWQGKGAVRLLDEDVERRVLLLERCLPGSVLWEEQEQDATGVMAEVFTRLWDAPAPAGPFLSLAEAAALWSEHLRVAYGWGPAPFEESLLDEALGFMATVEPPRVDDVVLHQDLHGGNVLRRNDDWVAIDPKPLVGERAFDLASFVRDRRDDMGDDRDSEAVVRRRLDQLCSALGVDWQRARGWALAHAMAWGFDSQGNFYPDLVLAARLISRC